MSESDPIGTVRQCPETKAVALKTGIDRTSHSWMVATIDRGGHYSFDEDVEGWVLLT